MRKKNHDWKVRMLLLLPALALPALACGGEVSPTKVGEVAPAEPVQQEQQPEEQIAPTEPAAPPQPTTYEIGDVISIGDSVLVVLGWEVLEGDQFIQPDEGNKFIAVDALLVNQSESPASVSSLMQMSLKDETAQVYDIDLGAAIAAGSSSPDGELSPGERIRGKVGFQIPDSASGLVFVFDADVFGLGKVFVNLGPTPVSLEPPAELVGEQTLPTFALGDVIQLGDLTLTVNEITFPSGDQFNQPDPGHKFLVVDLTLQNTGATAQAISTLLQMSLKDVTGQGYDVDLMAEVASGGASPDGEIAPGETIRGQVGFQVQEDAQGLLFVFDADVFGHGKVFVEIP